MKLTKNGVIYNIEEAPVKTLEERIARIEDRIAIEELMHNYCRCADNKDPVGQASNFCEDGILRLSEAYEPIQGRDNIAKYLAQFLDATISGSHYISNFQLYFNSPTTAVGYMYGYSWQCFTDFPKKSDCHRWMRYEVHYQKEADDQWRLKHVLMLSSGEYGGHRACEQYGRAWPPKNI